MKRKYLNIVSISYLIIITNGFSQVSDTILEAMKGENVIIQLKKRHLTNKESKNKNYFSGKLQQVNTNTVIIIGSQKGDVGHIKEISKNSILSIKREKVKLKRPPNRFGLGAIGFFVGFGLASYLQGDIKGGTVGLVWDMVNIGAIAASSYFSSLDAYRLNPQSVESVAFVFSYILNVFILSTLASRIFQTVRPYQWYKKNLAFLDGIYLLPDIAYNGYPGIKGGINFKIEF